MRRYTHCDCSQEDEAALSWGGLSQRLQLQLHLSDGPAGERPVTGSLGRDRLAATLRSTTCRAAAHEVFPRLLLLLLLQAPAMRAHAQWAVCSSWTVLAGRRQQRLQHLQCPM